jgi:starvation-inducible DNA-binding protein
MKKAQRNELQQVLIDTYAVYLKTQNYHWNVKGPWFHSLHEMFQEQYEELALAIDEIAERIRQMDIYVPATLTFFGKMANVDEKLEEEPSAEMVQSLIDANNTVKESISLAMQKAQQEHDEGTFDLLVQRLKAHDKAIWMMEMVLKSDLKTSKLSSSKTSVKH